MTENALNVVQGNPVATITPNTMLMKAVEQGADLDKLEKLMELQERWEKSEAKKAYTIAMSEFRVNCPIIDKTRKAYTGKYAGLAETLGQINDSLGKAGLSHSWRTDQADKGITVTCCITHIQGHQECTSMTAPADTSGSKNPIQAIASTITYLERYTLFAILGLASKEQDDDGQSAGIERINEDQVTAINDLLNKTRSDIPKFLKWLKAESVDQIQAAAYDQVIKTLERKLK